MHQDNLNCFLTQCQSYFYQVCKAFSQTFFAVSLWAVVCRRENECGQMEQVKCCEYSLFSPAALHGSLLLLEAVHLSGPGQRKEIFNRTNVGRKKKG